MDAACNAKSIADWRTKPACNAKSIADWCTKHAMETIRCSVVVSPAFGTAYARLVVPEAASSKVEQKDFWPAKTSARPWRFKSDNVGWTNEDAISTDEEQANS